MTDQTNYVRQGRNGQTPNKWITDLWFQAHGHEHIMGQRYDSKLVQNEYLRNLNMKGPMAEDNDLYKRKDYRHIQEKPKIDQMGKLKTELKFLERGMQIVRTKLRKLQ